MAYIKRIRALTNELDELRTKFFIDNKNEVFAKGVCAGIIISLNYIAEYFPDAYSKWSESLIDERVKKYIKRRRPIKRTSQMQGSE